MWLSQAQCVLVSVRTALRKTVEFGKKFDPLWFWGEQLGEMWEQRYHCFRVSQILCMSPQFPYFGGLQEPKNLAAFLKLIYVFYMLFQVRVMCDNLRMELFAGVNDCSSKLRFVFISD